MPNAELLAPAGDFETARAAFAAGADAVYCGLADFSARAFAKNFSLAELKSLVAYAHALPKPRKVYVTFNTLLDEDELESALGELAQLADARVDALIVQDLGVARLCRRHFPELVLHASTQLVAHNLEGVLALKELGFERVVLARELSAAEVASIARRSGVEIECFIHGALCYSISGLCLFSAMERQRSGNRGRCAYCCRLGYDDGSGRKTLAFSMKDLRLGEDVRKLVEAGAVSLKIEGRMKSPLYVASVTSYYRAILDGAPGAVSRADLESVFSRRTTLLYLNGKQDESPIDPISLGHLGTAIGTVKRVTKDREGRRWLRFHTARALERHDGLQFAAAAAGAKSPGFGIGEMRSAISRVGVFEVAAGSDVEILLPAEAANPELDAAVRPGATVYCSMSNALRRRFSTPPFRASDYAGAFAVDVAIDLAADEVRLAATLPGVSDPGGAPLAVELAAHGSFDAAKSPDKTFGAIEKSLSKLGGTDYRLGSLALSDPDRRFVPMTIVNDLRRDLVERLDEAMRRRRERRVERALDEAARTPSAKSGEVPARTLKLRADQAVPGGDWGEIVVAVSSDCDLGELAGRFAPESPVRLGLPVYNGELAFNRLRVFVKNALRRGYARWEADDLATLRLLRQLGVGDITADWTLYAFNSSSLALLAELGVRRFVASPENGRENLEYLAESGYAVEFLGQQSTPLFISLTKPAASSSALVGDDGRQVVTFLRDGLYVTTRPMPRVFAAPAGGATRIDLSWDAPADAALG